MPPTVAFLHTIHGLKELFDGLARELLPGCAFFHVTDDSLIQRLLATGGLTPPVYRRVLDHVLGAVEAGADAVQLTCSSISPCVRTARLLTTVPVLAIDEPMVREAVARHSRIGVIATNPATLVPSTELVNDTAREMGRTVEVETVLCRSAYQALMAGDRETHDRLVREDLARLLDSVEAVCLAQASMARLAGGLPGAVPRKPVYSSPRPAIQHLAGLFRHSA